MNSTEKDNIVQKAMCCAGTLGKTVADMYLSGHKCADKEFQKLFLLTSYIETLDCYQAPLEVTTYTVVAGDSVLSEWQIVIPCTVWDTVVTLTAASELTIDGVTTTIAGDNVMTFGEGITDLLENAAATISTYTISTCIDNNITIDITALCDTESITVALTGFIPQAGTYNATQAVTGNCSGNTLETTVTTTEYTNCLTEDQADSIATQISKICDLCDEH